MKLTQPKKLTKSNIRDIYWFISNGFSQRFTARHLGHSRSTIARHLKPIAMADHIMNGYGNLADTEYDMYVVNNEKSLWKQLAIIGAIGHVLVLLSYFFL